MRIALSASSIALACLIAPAALAFDIPVNDGYVTDAVSNPRIELVILTAAEEGEIEADLHAYDRETSNQVAVLIVPTLSGADISQVGVDVLRAWGIGTEAKNNGILILISYADRTMAIATGYGLEGAVPDIVAKGIIDEEMTPYFREGEFGDGLKAGIDALKKHIGGEYTADRYSGDGGSVFPWILFILFAFGDVIAAGLGRTKSWWLGGIVGGGFGLILTVLYTWWLSIPVLVGLGLILDYVLSQNNYTGRKGRGGRGGGFWGGGFGGSGGGGFGGFGGGSGGGGGASGKW